MNPSPKRPKHAAGSQFAGLLFDHWANQATPKCSIPLEPCPAILPKRGLGPAALMPQNRVVRLDNFKGGRLLSASFSFFETAIYCSREHPIHQFRKKIGPFPALRFGHCLVAGGCSSWKNFIQACTGWPNRRSNSNRALSPPSKQKGRSMSSRA